MYLVWEPLPSGTRPLLSPVLRMDLVVVGATFPGNFWDCWKIDWSSDCDGLRAAPTPPIPLPEAASGKIRLGFWCLWISLASELLPSVPTTAYPTPSSTFFAVDWSSSLELSTEASRFTSKRSQMVFLSVSHRTNSSLGSESFGKAGSKWNPFPVFYNIYSV